MKIWTVNSASDVFPVSQVLDVISASLTINSTKMMFQAGIHGPMLFHPRTSEPDPRQFEKFTNWSVDPWFKALQGSFVTFFCTLIIIRTNKKSFRPTGFEPVT